MNDLLIHNVTRKQIEDFLKEPSQFLLLVGAPGSGKLTLARNIAGSLLNEEIDAEHYKVLHLKLQPNKSEISIDQVRAAIGELKLTAPGKGEVRRILLIEDGQYLSEEAQNALLKTLEEPPADTRIIMSVDSAGSLLPTIISRGQTLEVKAVDRSEAVNFFGQQFSEGDIEKAWLLADGLPGLTAALLNQSEEHELKNAVSEAKQFITATKYQRLIRAGDFTKNRRQVELLIEGLQKIIKTAQRQTILDDKPLSQRKMIAARRQLDELHDAVSANVSPKTIYLKLCLNLGI